MRAILRLITGAAVVAACLFTPSAARAQTTEVVEYYALDAIGSIRVVFDANGAILSRRDYEPFGKPVTPIGSDPKLFAGLFRDDESGLDYAQARMYHSRTGRFNAPDPVYAGMFNPQGWNRYSYALSSPLLFVDPNGLDPQGPTSNPTTNCPVGTYYCVTPPQACPPPRICRTVHNPPVSSFSLATNIGLVLGQPSQPSGVPGPDWGHILATRTFPGQIVSAVATVVSSESSGSEKVAAAVVVATAGVPLANVGRNLLQVGRFKFTQTAGKHIFEISKQGVPVRPYMNSPLLIDEIMSAGKPFRDPGGLPNALRWEVPGTYNKVPGTWELVIDPAKNTIYHFVFKGSKW